MLEDQYEGQVQIFGLKYKEDYQTLMNELRHYYKTKQIDQRLFELTSILIKQTIGNFTLWFLRRKCIKELNINLEQELKFTNSIILESNKNYQIWYFQNKKREHRRQIIEMMNQLPQNEIKFIDEQLLTDNKNYHIWIYRRQICQFFNLYYEELQANIQYLKDDPLNNSVWNYRHFLINNQKVIDYQSEINFVLQYISDNSENESAWNYLNGYFEQTDLFNSDYKDNKFLYDQYPLVEELCLNIYKNDYEKSRFATNTLVFIYIQQKKTEKAKEFIEILIDDLDSFRQQYWNFVLNQI